MEVIGCGVEVFACVSIVYFTIPYHEYSILYHTMLACVRHQRRHLATIDTYTGNQIAHKIIFLLKRPGDRLSIDCKESLPRRDRNRSLNDFE